jgi:hypothetical protein
MGIESLLVNLSGGAANADPAVSTGGVMSSVSVVFQTVALSLAIPGVTVLNAGGNALGAGTLAYSFSGKVLAWTPPGQLVSGAAVSINANGLYLVRGANPTDGYVIVSVTSSLLSAGSNYSATATVANAVAAMLPPVTKDTALAGATEYFLLYLRNTGASTIKAVSIGLQVDTQGADTLSISSIATKNTTELQAAAAGHAYTPLGGTVALGDMLTTDYWGFWVKRVTPASSTNGITNNTFKLLVSALT